MKGGTPRNAVDQQILFSFLFMLRMMFFPLNVEHCTHSFITFMFYVSNIVLNDTVVDWHLEPIWHICMPLSAALTCTDNSLLLSNSFCPLINIVKCLFVVKCLFTW